MSFKISKIKKRFLQRINFAICTSHLNTIHVLHNNITVSMCEYV